MGADSSKIADSAKTVASGSRMATGTIQVFLAESLLLPTGLVTAAFLTRQLGPEGYGVLMLATTIISWIGWSITSAFTRTTIKFIGEAEDWQAIASTVLQLHLLLGMAAAAVVGVFAQVIANALGEPGMAAYLRLFALEVPIFCLTYAHRSVLVGLGKFSQRAIATAVRWVARMVLIVAFVGAGLSLWGAILGSVASAIVELGVCRMYVHPPLMHSSRFPMRKLWGYAVPLFLLALSLRLYDKLDLFMLKLLGGTAAEAGFYATAQNLSLMPSLFTLAFVPLLLSTLTRILSTGDQSKAQHLSRDAMRLVLLLLPFAALGSGSAAEIMALLFSSTFLPAAPLFALLIFSAVAMAMIAVTTAILTAASKPTWTIALAGPMVPGAIAANGWIIPRFGSIGAATVTTTVATLAAIATIGAVHRIWKIVPPMASLIRSLVMSGLVYGLASLWTTIGWWLVVKLVLLSSLIPVGLVLLGELSDRELGLLRSAVDSVFKKCRPH
ncbi:MAG: oligosaccharide flippase family protein [Oscillatoriales cyanobacterium C42_A2020_001]|nr:oligosaccharide flippase family protein [Leptolyngbyaceae cyanobacterium C42_A2020_001]